MASRFVRGLLPILTLGLCTVTAFAQTTPEYRGLWVNGWAGLYDTSSKCTTVINQTRAGNLNSVSLQMRRRGDAFYNSNYEPKNPTVASSFDPLADLITKAHDTSNGKQRLDVHAWMVTYHIWQGSTPPAASNHPFNLHPDWLLRNSAGQTFIGNEYSFDPGHPEVQRHTYNVFMDVVSRYNIDAINFDYIRYASADEGYNPVAVARFNQRFGRTGQPSPTDPVWKQWRRDQITALVRKIYLNIQATKPQVKLIADTITWSPAVSTATQWTNSARAYNDVLQDWRGWMEEGILDINRPMAYFREFNSVQAADYRTWIQFAANQKHNRHVIIGPALYLNSVSDGIRHMRLSRVPTPSGKKADGVFGYDYNTPNNQGIALTTTLNSWVAPSSYDSTTPPIFSQKVAIPSMPWKTSPTRGHLKGFVRGGTTANDLDGATMSITGPVNRSFISDGTGFFGSVDLPPGSYTLNASYSGFSPVSTTFSITSGSVTTRNLLLPAPPGEIIIDNGQAAYVGTWNTGTSSTDKYGSDYRFAHGVSGTATHTATYRPNIPSNGIYDVYIWYPQGSNRASNAPWRISSAAGAITVNVNQQINGGKWVLISSGRTFNAGTTGFVRLSNSIGSTTPVVMADAVRFVRR
ncbi:MAG: family 10 glycosylhydrolase [Verrucomicrobia bacterium]|nr:family 10 glycosylhydrolase [Verrucomicrobiota bacterium]